MSYIVQPSYWHSQTYICPAWHLWSLWDAAAAMPHITYNVEPIE